MDPKPELGIQKADVLPKPELGKQRKRGLVAVLQGKIDSTSPTENYDPEAIFHRSPAEVAESLADGGYQTVAAWPQTTLSDFKEAFKEAHPDLGDVIDLDDSEMGN